MICSVCKKHETFVFKSNGKLRKICVSCMRRFKCESCKFTTSSKVNLNLHIKQIHDKIKDIECKKCNFKCSTISILQQHNNSIKHNNRIDDYEYFLSKMFKK